VRVSKTFSFEASHILPKHPGKCSRLHGHSWKLTVSVDGPIELDTGFVVDYAIISMTVQPLIDLLDHHHLGTWEGFVATTYGSWGVPGLLKFYPTSENLLKFIGEWLLSWSHPLNWSELKLNETCTSEAILTREEYERTTNR
jgi:6-pyruvoyltetrahydropterin/6-carboxytetrahydropterin synthase